LRPKISPNIKPLVPTIAGISSEEHTTRILATKSNYQHLVEGTTVPGVVYPSELSTNLTSKRTSHKIAEQGRRNRINTALAVIATLLPGYEPKDGENSDGESDGDEKDGRDGKKGKKAPSSTPNSKASTVELAIEYIKQLKQEVADATKRAEDAEKRLGMQGEGQ
jgi:hypothetical protein